MEIICKIYLNNYLSRFSSLLPGGLKILILNGSGLQIQTNGTAWSILGVEVGNGSILVQYIAARRIENPYTQWVWIANPDQRYDTNIRRVGWVGMEHPPDREIQREVTVNGGSAIVCIPSLLLFLSSNTPLRKYHWSVNSPLL